jgi:hypothetical protein
MVLIILQNRVPDKLTFTWFREAIAYVADYWYNLGAITNL